MRLRAGVTRCLLLCAVLLVLPLVVASQPPPPPPPLPDLQPNLQPTEITFDPSTAVLGGTVFFDSGVQNTGEFGSDVFNIKWFVDNQEVGAYGSHAEVPAGQTVLDGNSQFSWTFDSPGTYSLTFTVDVDNHIEESNEEDNSTTIDVVVDQSLEPQPTPPGWTTDQGTTDSSGSVTFVDRAVDGEVVVQVIDQAGNPVSNATVYFIADGSRARVFLIDPNYEPVWEEVEYASSQQVQPRAAQISFVILGAIALTIAAPDIIEFSINPPRVDLELGYVRSCLTYDQFITTASLGVSVFGLHTLTKSITWAILKKDGLKEVVAKSAEHILRAVGREWPWVGTWCFRMTESAGITWIYPETDTIKHALFRVNLSWDKGDTDVDLHIFDSRENHSYWQSLQGVPGGELDRDDRDGYGPEIYRQYSHVGASYYDIYMHYYSDNGNGPTTAHVDVFDDTEQRIIIKSKSLSDQEMWYIGRVSADFSGPVEPLLTRGLDPDIITIFSVIPKP